MNQARPNNIGDAATMSVEVRMMASAFCSLLVCGLAEGTMLSFMMRLTLIEIEIDWTELLPRCCIADAGNAAKVMDTHQIEARRPCERG